MCLAQRQNLNIQSSTTQNIMALKHATAVLVLFVLQCFSGVVVSRNLHQNPSASPASSGGATNSQQPKQQQFGWDASLGVINGSRPIEIAHRGSPGQLPDHTLQGYHRAIQEGADCVECDVTVTKDLQLVCRHEPWLQNTTDASKKFPEYVKTYNIPEAGGNISGIFTIDLTLPQIKTLRAAQPFPWRDQSYNYLWEVPTFAEYVAVVTNASNPKVTCIYPETKHPTFFNNHPVLKAANTTIDDLLMNEMQRLGYNLQAGFGSPDWLKMPAFIQSFEQNNLRYWKNKTALPLVQLVDAVPAVDTNNSAEYLTSEPGIREIAQYAWGYAPWKGLYVVTDDNNNNIVKVDPAPVRLATQYGMPVTVWTLRNEPSYLANQYNGNIANEFNLIFNVLGVMGGFTDHTYVLMNWLLNDYKPAPRTAADAVAAGNYSVFQTAGTPTWQFAPVCQVQPNASNPIVRDQQGHPWLTDRGVSCAYWAPGSRAPTM